MMREHPQNIFFGEFTPEIREYIHVGLFLCYVSADGLYPVIQYIEV